MPDCSGWLNLQWNQILQTFYKLEMDMLEESLDRINTAQGQNKDSEEY